jgi:hypothetical protein
MEVPVLRIELNHIKQSLLHALDIRHGEMAKAIETGIDLAYQQLPVIVAERVRASVLNAKSHETPQEAEARLMRVFSLGFMPFSMLYRGPKVDQRMHRDPGWRKLIRKWCSPARYKAFMRNV